MSVRRAPVVAAVLLSMFMSAMEATVIATAMPTVVADLHGIELYGWVTAIYMLASTFTIPVWGRLADVRGRRPVMLAGLAFFLVGSVLSGAAGSMWQLIVFRAVQGVGAGALQPVALTIIGDLFTIEERGRIQGLFGAVWGFAGISGPLLGGLIVRALGWRWVFYINVPFGLLSAALLVAYYREGERGATETAAPFSLLRDRLMVVASAAGALMGAVMIASLTYLPLYVQSVLRGTPTEAGAAVAPMLIGWPVASAVAGRLLSRISYRVLVRGGLITVGLSTVALWRLLATGAGTSSMRAVMLVFGAGMGFANTALLVSVQERAGFAARGVATASTMFFRSIGGAAAVGALGALLAARVAGDVPESLLRRMLGPDHGAGIDPAVLHRAGTHLASGMGTVFGVIAVLGVMAAATGLLLPAPAARA